MARYLELILPTDQPKKIGRVVLFDLHRKELEKPWVLALSKLEHTIARRGLWNHLAAVRKIPRASMAALETVDGSIVSALGSIDRKSTRLNSSH